MYKKFGVKTTALIAIFFILIIIVITYFLFNSKCGSEKYIGWSPIKNDDIKYKNVNLDTKTDNKESGFNFNDNDKKYVSIPLGGRNTTDMYYITNYGGNVVNSLGTNLGVENQKLTSSYPSTISWADSYKNAKKAQYEPSMEIYKDVV